MAHLRRRPTPSLPVIDHLPNTDPPPRSLDSAYDDDGAGGGTGGTGGAWGVAGAG